MCGNSQRKGELERSKHPAAQWWRRARRARRLSASYRQLLKALCSRRLISRPMIDPAPYKTIAVASTFSPRFKQVLSEAKRIRDRFSSDLRVIYVGERNEDTIKKFSDVLAQLHLPSDSIIHYERGDPAEAILRVIADNNIDMIVAGALEKFVLSAGATEVPIEARCIRGNTGLAASDFVQSVEADLLVVPVETSEGTSGQLPNNIAWIIDVIPCNLWVIR